MLRDLTKTDWLRILGLRDEEVPRALILRGTRNLERNYTVYREHFENVREIGSPNGLVEHVFIGDWNGAKVAYASVYGAAMASEVTHLFGVLGTELVLQTGRCGLWKYGANAGDIFIPVRAACGEGAAQYYVKGKHIVAPSLELTPSGAEFESLPLPVHFGAIYTTAALFAEGKAEIEHWAAEGWDGVDMETATTFAVAEHFGMKSAAILFAFDNPRDHGDIVLNEAEKDERRQLGNATMIQLTFEVLRSFLNARANG